MVSYTYDVGSNAIGYLSSVLDQSGHDLNSYHRFGRVTSEQRNIRQHPQVGGLRLQPRWFSAGSFHYPSGAAVTTIPTFEPDRVRIDM